MSSDAGAANKRRPVPRTAADGQFLRHKNLAHLTPRSRQAAEQMIDLKRLKELKDRNPNGIGFQNHQTIGAYSLNPESDKLSYSQHLNAFKHQRRPES